MILKLAAFTLGLTVATGAAAAPLHLVCLGNGSANRITSSSGSAWASNGASAWGQVIGTRDVPFDDQVNIELADDGTGQIRMPRAMLPKIRGGKDGWFEIRDVVKGQDEITGTVQVNVFNSPKLRIDRIRGHVSLSGKSGDYAGICQPFDPATVQRAF
ncbi:hypothetical protein [Sphingobium sp. Cam5-1]|uniref:hypothetical protein n=1 Tax=Sphingobium sp. Cam5-1 TaxID=2789327 RepID=UPI0018AD1D2F|nr:hypothetical protein [Sphingobium sp. Cam5-1]QPI75370.1 hypothetical protein IZV00_19630 [Sphingobium sp. Cam5-1]